MGRMAWVAVIVLLGAGVAGCIGGTRQPGELEPGETDANATAPTVDGNASTLAGSPSSQQPDDPEETTAACEEGAAEIRASIASHLEDPFADRDPAEPELLVCGDAGVLRLAAYGPSGPGIFSMDLELSAATSCDGYIAAAATGGSDRLYVGAWDHPDGSGSIGAATGSSGFLVSAFAGPVDTDELAGTGGGSTAWGSGFEEAAFQDGLHRLTAMGNAWGGWETSLTETAPFLFLLACEDPIRFHGFTTADTLEMFSGDELDTGAGVRGPLFLGASGGRALELGLGDGGVLRLGGFSIGGAAAVQITDAEGTTEHVVAPLEGTQVRHEVPPGALTLDLVRGGVAVIVAGGAHGPLLDTTVEAVVGP